MSTDLSSRARAGADLAEGSILAAVEIAAPPERVFRALTSPEISEWWGSAGVYRTTEWSGDVRVGGCWRAAGVGAGGKPFSVHGEDVEIDPPRQLVHTWRADWDAGSVTRVSYRLESIDGGTRLTLRHTGFTSRPSCSAHASGRAMVLDWLSAHVAPARLHFLLRLLPPRPTFPADMSAEEAGVMREHVAYWGKLLAEGTAIAFGPVADPRAVWGLGLVEVGSAEGVKTVEAGDPVIRCQLGFSYEVLPMPRLEARPRPS